jgi:chaperonin cofactor prefoldin
MIWIKVFLDVRGFVYVIGLSRETIDKVLSEAIRAFGVTGEEYIRKIIQIPITIQDWNESDIRILIDDILQKSKLDEEFSNIVRQNKELIASAVDLNPRELKRFINNFIVSYEIYSTDIQTFIWDEITGNDEIKFKKFLKQRFNMEWTATAKIEKIGMKEIKISTDSHSLSIKIDDKRARAIMTLDDFVLPYEYNVDSTNGKLAISPPNVKPKELLVIQALKEKWKEFYREISSNKALREGIKDYVDLEVDDRNKRFEERKNDTKKPLDFERILMNYDPASKMWDFLRDNRETIFGIEDWEIYRRATESVKEFPITKLMDIKHESAQISATIPTEIYDDSGYIVTERSRDELLQSLAKLPRDIMLQLDRWRNEEKIEKEKFNSLSKKIEKIDHYLKHQKIDDALDELGEILENLPVSVESDRLRSKVRKTLTSYKRVYDYNY